MARSGTFPHSKFRAPLSIHFLRKNMTKNKVPKTTPTEESGLILISKILRYSLKNMNDIDPRTTQYNYRNCHGGKDRSDFRKLCMRKKRRKKIDTKISADTKNNAYDKPYGTRKIINRFIFWT